MGTAADDKPKPTAILTGSTGNAALDATPRGAASFLIGLVVGAGLVALGVDEYVVGGATAAIITLVFAAFDQFIKPRITPKP